MDKISISSHPLFVREALGKALLVRASRGEWEPAMALADKLGAGSWQRRGLMGHAPQEAGFLASWRGAGMPDGSWIAAKGALKAEEGFLALEELARKNMESGAPTPDKARNALEWLAWSAPGQGVKAAFEFWSASRQGAPILDAGGWAEAMASRAHAGELGSAWRGARGLWMVAGSLDVESSGALAEALWSAGLLPTLRCARDGASELSQWAIEKLAPDEALALLGAALCKPQEWAEFEQALGASRAPDESDGPSGPTRWMELAAKAAGLGKGGFEQIEVGRPWSEVGRGSGDQAACERWDKAFGLLAAKAGIALAAPGMELVRSWIIERSPGWALESLDPKSAEGWDPSNLSAQDVVDSLGKLIESDGASAVSNAKAAARRMWSLSMGMPERERAQSKSASEAALVLWRSARPAAFLAYAQELAGLSGGAGQAARICRFPSPALSNEYESQPGAPGHAMALAVAFPMDAVDLEGEPIWRKRDTQEHAMRWLWDRFRLPALTAMIDADVGLAWSKPTPAPLPKIKDWGSIDLDLPLWRGKGTADEVARAWEGAFEALAHVAVGLKAGARFAMPPAPSAASGPDDLPSKAAWSVHALDKPRELAEWACGKLIAKGLGAAQALRVLEALRPEAKDAVASAMPEALEDAVASGGYDRVIENLADICRSSAQALAASSSEAFAPDERLCSALMCAGSYGVARLARTGVGSELKRGEVQKLGKELEPCLAQAAAIMMAVGFEPPVHSQAGFGGSDLAGKAAWGSLALSSMVSGRAGDANALWSQRWSGVELDPSNPWANSCLSAIFSPDARQALRSDEAQSLAREASLWLKGFGADGLGRVGEGRSALEMAVDCFSEQKRGHRNKGADEVCFGVDAVKDLIAMGADPSSPQAPKGVDAMALCAGLDRRCAPSSVMKALAKSSKAVPGRGALMPLLASGRSKLSDKMNDELKAAGLSHPELDMLALLGAQAGGSSYPGRARAPEVAWLKKALEISPKAMDWAADGLLSKMVESRAAPSACAEVSELLASLGVSIARADEQNLLIRGLLKTAEGPDQYNQLVQCMEQWARAGASREPFDAVLIAPGWAQACADQGLGPKLHLADAMMARAVGMLDTERYGNICGSLALAAMRIGELGYGSPSMACLAGKLLAREREISPDGFLAAALGEDEVAKIEALAITDGLQASSRPSPASKRL
jgi:hypothetical protein